MCNKTLIPFPTRKQSFTCPTKFRSLREEKNDQALLVPTLQATGQAGANEIAFLDNTSSSPASSCYPNR